MLRSKPTYGITTVGWGGGLELILDSRKRVRNHNAVLSRYCGFLHIPELIVNYTTYGGVLLPDRAAVSRGVRKSALYGAILNDSLLSTKHRIKLIVLSK